MKTNWKKRQKALSFIYEKDLQLQLTLRVMFNFILDVAVCVLCAYYSIAFDSIFLTKVTLYWGIYTIVTAVFTFILGTISNNLNYPSPDKYYKKYNIQVNAYVLPMQSLIQKCLYLNNFGKYRVCVNNGWLEFHYISLTMKIVV